MHADSAGAELATIKLVLLEGIQPGGEEILPCASSEAAFDLRGNPAGHSQLAEAFLAVASDRAERPAIVVGSTSYAYGTLGCAAVRVAAFLSNSASFEPGCRVALLLENSPEYIAAFYGVLLAGGVAVPLPPTIETHRLIRIHRTCRLRVLLTTSSVLAKRDDLAAPSEPADLAGPASASLDIPERAPSNVPTAAMILFTSGSTGDPKGVMLSEGNLLSNAESIASYLPLTCDDRALALLPFYHAYGNSVLQTHLLRGATLVVDGSVLFPGSVLEALRAHQVNSLAGVPEMFHGLLAYSNLGRERLPALRYMTVAGGALPREAKFEIARHIAPARLFVMYGQSEATARLAYLPPELLVSRPDSIGRAIPGVTLRVVDSGGNPAAPGEVGELVARGPNIMLGYCGDPQATADVLRDGWLHTGDLATVDREGYFFVKSRKSDLVKVQGCRIHPREIEDALAERLPQSPIAVVPYETHLGTRLALFVVGRGAELSADGVRRLCRTLLPGQKVPSHIEVVDRFPLNSSFKLDRVALSRRAQAAGSRPSRITRSAA